jgi:hypothetical protein
MLKSYIEKGYYIVFNKLGNEDKDGNLMSGHIETAFPRITGIEYNKKKYYSDKFISSKNSEGFYSVGAGGATGFKNGNKYK